MFEGSIEFRKIYNVYIIGYLGILIYYSDQVIEVFYVPAHLRN